MVAVAWLLKTPAAVLKQKQNWFWRVAIATIAARCSVTSQQGGPIGHITNHSGKVKTGEMTNMFHSICRYCRTAAADPVPATTLYRYVDIYSPCVCWGNVVISSGAV